MLLVCIIFSPWLCCGIFLFLTPIWFVLCLESVHTILGISLIFSFHFLWFASLKLDLLFWSLTLFCLKPSFFFNIHYFDSRMSFDKHISMTCKAANMYLRNISHIRKFLDQKTAEILIHAFVSSKLDFCNSLLFNSPKHQLQRIQKIQNTAARIATKSNRFEHITPVLHDLHWLTHFIQDQL